MAIDRYSLLTQELYTQALTQTFGRMVVKMHQAPECATVQLLAEGRTVEEISELIQEPPSTVERHLRTLRALLGARTNEHLVAVASARGIVSTDHTLP